MYAFSLKTQLPFHLYRVNINLSMPSALTSLMLREDSSCEGAKQKKTHTPCLFSAYLLFNWVIKQQTHRQMIKVNEILAQKKKKKKTTRIWYEEYSIPYIVLLVADVTCVRRNCSISWWEAERERGRKQRVRSLGGNIPAVLLNLASAWVQRALDFINKL